MMHHVSHFAEFYPRAVLLRPSCWLLLGMFLCSGSLPSQQREADASLGMATALGCASSEGEATNKNSHQSPFPRLSRRKKEVLQLIVDEFTTQEIADKLFISFGTVETHQRNILSKMGARNAAGLVRIALVYDLLS